MRNQQELQNLTREMKTHIRDTGEVTLKLKNLTENTVDDSAIVRIITIISAIYLPGSFVGVSTKPGLQLYDKTHASTPLVPLATLLVIFTDTISKTLFGSNYFEFDAKSRQLIMASNFWIFVALWLALTSLTGFIYFFSYMRKSLKAKSHLKEKEHFA